MALFKILRGEKNTLGNQPLHDGWAYFTPEDSNLYVDVVGTIGGIEYNDRIKVGDSNGGVYVQSIEIAPEDWTEGVCIIENSNAKNSKLTIMLDTDSLMNKSDEEQFNIKKSATFADIHTSIIENSNNIEIKCLGTVPLVALPLILTLIKKAE